MGGISVQKDRNQKDISTRARKSHMRAKHIIIVPKRFEILGYFFARGWSRAEKRSFFRKSTPTAQNMSAGTAAESIMNHLPIPIAPIHRPVQAWLPRYIIARFSTTHNGEVEKRTDTGAVSVLFVSKSPRQSLAARRRRNQVEICFFRGHAPRKKHFSARKCAPHGRARSGLHLLSQKRLRF